VLAEGSSLENLAQRIVAQLPPEFRQETRA
jgi:hypothetical protein